MKRLLLTLHILILMTVIPAAFAASPAKASTEDWLYYLPILGLIVTGVLLVNLAFIVAIVRKVRAQRILKGV